MRYLVIGDDATIPDLCEAIVNLRGRQQLAVIESTRVEIGDDINELLELLLARITAPVAPPAPPTTEEATP